MSAPRAAFQHRDFRFYVASSLLANLAEQMLGVAVGWQIYALTHRAIDLGYVGLVQFAPAFFLSLPAGHVADRTDRARIVATGHLVLAACALALLAITMGGVGSVLPIYAVLLFVGVARAFSGPAGQALVPGLVPDVDFPNAVTWSSTAWQVATIVGPALGGVLYGTGGGASVVYTTSAALFALASSFAFALRPRRVTAEATTTA